MSARGVLVALAACSTHHIGTMANRSAVLRARVLTLPGAGAPAERCWEARNSRSSASSSSRTGGGFLLLLYLMVLFEQFDHLTPHLNAAFVGVSIGIFDDRRVGAKLMLGIENNPGGAAHALPSDGDVFVDLLDGAFNHERIVHTADQFHSAPVGQDTGEAHDVGLDSLDGPVSDCARAELCAAGAARPTHRTA